MALDPAMANNTFDRYIEELRSLWRDSRDAELPFRVKAAMERMLASTRPDDPWMAEIIRDADPSRELYRDPDYGFVQMGHVHPPGHGNTPHDHGPCWVVYGAYQGVTEIPLYERTDDGRNPDKADLRIKEVHRLEPGVVYPLPDGPDPFDAGGGTAGRGLPVPQRGSHPDPPPALQPGDRRCVADRAAGIGGPPWLVGAGSVAGDVRWPGQRGCLRDGSWKPCTRRRSGREPRASAAVWVERS